MLKRTKWKDKLLHIKLPHTYVLLTMILLAVVVMAYVIPSGQYDRVFDEAANRTIVLPDSFHYVAGKQPGLFDIFLSVYRGYVSAANILFLVVFAYGFVYMLNKNGTLHAAVHALIRLVGDLTQLLIPVGMVLFGLLGSTLGIFEETYRLVPVFAGIMAALGYDTLVGGVLVYVGVATGFAAATVNPFSVGIAQTIAEVPLNSGVWFRAIVFVVFEGVAIWYVMRYARMVKADPTKSVLYNCDEVEPLQMAGDPTDVAMTGRRKLCLVLFVGTVGIMLYGTTCLGWYIDELSAMFLAMMFVVGVAGVFAAISTILMFIEMPLPLMPPFLKIDLSGVPILIIGFTRGILITMQEALISATIVHALSSLLKTSNPVLSAIGMLVLQSIINFFIDGSSSQATITMPIMAPVADIVGLSRQTAVLAYCFGDGFSDMFWPTNCSLQCGLMGIPLNRWYRFITPLFFIMVALQFLFMVISVYVF